MASTFIQLVNKLRDKFNEPRLTVGSNFTTTVGFDQLTKDAINYAYQDILGSEAEWPFLHQDVTFLAKPGTRLYIPTITPATGLTTDIRGIDWDSFYISENATTATVSVEQHDPPTGAPYEITVNNASTWYQDVSVSYVEGVTTTAFTQTDKDPSPTQYAITGQGVYVFNSVSTTFTGRFDITYKTYTRADDAIPTPTSKLNYLDYDAYRYTMLQSDDNSLAVSGGKPVYVYKGQKQGQVGLTPVPNTFYLVNFECWLEPVLLSGATDTNILPLRYEKVLLDGAAVYCYEHREDVPLKKETEARFLRGVQRMRTELINRDCTMRSGFIWR
jgi:hypothetical protein